MPAAVRGDYQSLFVQGLQAVDFGRWRDAVILFAAAIDENPDSGGLLRPYGTRYEPYVPHYYLGLSLYRLGRYVEALEAWETSERQGPIGYPRNKRKYRNMVRLRQELAERVREDAGRIREEIRSAQRRLEELRAQAQIVLRGLSPASESGGRIESVVTTLAQVSGEMEQSGGEMTPEQLREAARELQEAWANLEKLAEQVAREEKNLLLKERMEREAEIRAAWRRRYERAASLIEREATRMEGLDELRALVHETALQPDPRALGLAPHLLLARGMLELYEVEAAAVELELARRRGVARPDELSGVEQELVAARSRNRAVEDYRRAATILDQAEGCEPAAAYLLERVNEVWASAEKPAEVGEWAPHARLAASYLDCGLREDAEESWRRASARGEPAPAVERLRARLDGGAAPREWASRLAAAYAEATGRAQNGGCDLPAVWLIEGLTRLELTDQLRAEGVDLRPHLDLSRLYLACGDLEAAEAQLRRARDRGAEGRPEIDRQRALLAEAREFRAQDRLRADALSRFLTAAAAVEMGECDSESQAELERAWGLLEGTDAPVQLGLTPNLQQAMAHRNCGRRDGVALGVQRAKQRGEARPELIEELESWLSEDRLGEVYRGSYALLVAGYDYDKEATGWEPLPGARGDIDALNRGLSAHGFDVEVLENPTYRRFDEAISSFIAKKGRVAEHRLLVYYAGHGWTEEAFGVKNGYIVPTDAPHPERDLSTALQRLVSMDVFEGYAKEMLARHALFVFDTCFGGAIFEATRSRAETVSSSLELQELVRSPVRMFISAGNERESVPDFSYFRRAFVRGLNGEADADTDGLVLGQELGAFLRAEVSEHSSTTPQWGRMTLGELGLGDILFHSLEHGASAPDGTLRAQIDYWSVVSAVDEEGAYRAYLAAYPEGYFAALARMRLRESDSGRGGAIAGR